MDCRFEACIGYNLRSGVIPDEAKVKELKSNHMTPNGSPAPGLNIPMLAPPIFAVFLVCLGAGVFRIESRKYKARGK